MYFNPLRIFIPASLVFMALAAALFVYRVVVGGGFMTTIVVLFAASMNILSIGMLADLIDKRIQR